MDISTGSTDGRDALRAYLRAGDDIPDAELMDAWDTAVDATEPWIKPGFNTDAPAGVRSFVIAVAAHAWRTRDSAGDTQILPDGTINSQVITSALVARYRVLSGRYAATPRVIA